MSMFSASILYDYSHYKFLEEIYWKNLLASWDSKSTQAKALQDLEILHNSLALEQKKAGYRYIY